jgi:hypothetical protein
MLRVLALAATLALALPTLALAQEHHDEHKGAPPHGAPPHGPPPARAAVVPHGPPGGAMAHPHGPPSGVVMHPGGPAGAFAHPGGPAGAQFMFRGHPYNRVHLAPFTYPPGYGYRRWAVGAALPPVFWGRDYWYADWASLGLPPPPPGAQWVRYGPDMLLVDVQTGQVLDVANDVFY